jgi:hypothetical protein
MLLRILPCVALTPLTLAAWSTAAHAHDSWSG